MKCHRCSWPNCQATLCSAFSLKRHIKIVHEGIRTHACTKPDCSAIFGSKYLLKRHLLSVHITAEERERRSRNYKCQNCEKTFSLNQHLKRHSKTMHGEQNESNDNGDTNGISKPSFICAECGKNFVRKDSLSFHIFSIHHSDKIERFECHHCGRKFKTKYCLKNHILTRHKARPLGKSDVCVLCRRPEYREQLHKHYTEVHGVDLNVKKLSFPSMQEFLTWKKEVEDSTVTRFVAQRWSSKNKLSRIYKCHRSGTYVEKSSPRKRARYLRGSKKINGECPAFIKIRRRDENSPVEVTFSSTHLGHNVNVEDELKYIFLRKDEREEIARLIASGVPKRKIIDDLAEVCSDALLADYRNAMVNKIHLLTRKTIRNIEISYNLKSSENFVTPFQEDSKNVEELVNEHKDSILFYKRQNQSCEEFLDCNLKDDDLILIFMCPSQEAMLKKHASSVVCMDGTQDVNPDGFILHTIHVLDYDGESFPGAFVLSNRNDKMVMKVFLRCLRNKVGVITPNTLMSDMHQNYYHAWVEEMGTPNCHIHCIRQLWREWSKHLPVGEVGKALKQELKDLVNETSKDAFHEKLVNFLFVENLPDNELKENQPVDPRGKFLEYFKKEYCLQEKYKLWSYAYRLQAGANTYNHIESFHRFLKDIHGNGQTLQDLFSCLCMIVTYVTDKLKDQRLKCIDGKLPPRLAALRRAHKLALSMESISIEVIDDGWLVPSFQASKDGCVEMYTIRKIRNFCPAEEDKDIRKCNLICTECNECAHKYTCTCIENAIKSRMCEHIHVLLLQMNKDHAIHELVFDTVEEILVPDDSDYLIPSLSSSGNALINDSRKSDMLKKFLRIAEKITDVDEIDVVDSYLSHLEAVLFAENM